MRLNSTEKNALDSLNMLLELSKVRATRRTLREKLWKHPDFPSLVSLSDTLEELKVANIAVELTSDRLSEIPLPALAYLTIDGGILALIRNVTADTVEWLHTKRGWQKNHLEEFNRIWNGVALLIEPDEQSGEVNYSKQRQQELIENSRYPFIVLGSLICFTLILSYASQIVPVYNNWQIYALLGLKIAGTVVSVLLVAYNFDSNNPLLRKVCQLNSRTNCNSILSSEAAKLFSWLSWAEVGLTYFTGGSIVIIVSLLVPHLSAIKVLLWLNLLSLPYTVYSIYYQIRIAKEFCLLCLSVQLILWLEFFTGFHLLTFTNVGGLDVLCISFLLVYLAWSSLKRPLELASQLAPLQREIYKIKFDSRYLCNIFNKQPLMPPIFEEMHVVKIGNHNVVNTLTVVTNPSCLPCAKSHKEIKNLIKNVPDIIKIEIVFITPNGQDSVSGRMARWILSSSSQDAPDNLHRCFENDAKGADEWNKYIDEDEAYKQLSLHLRWCELAHIKSTPTFFLNGSKIPALYKISDLPFLCKNLEMQKEPNTLAELANLNKLII